MSEISLSFSTKVRPAKKFLLDGEEFSILGVDHLTPDDENVAMALFARHSFLLEQQAAEPNVLKGKEIADRLRKTRIAILCKLTDIPEERASGLPLSVQAKLMEAIQAELDKEDDEALPKAADEKVPVSADVYGD